MSLAAQDLPGATNASEPGAPIGLRVMILIPHNERREALHRLLDRLAPNSRIETADGALDVLRRLTHAPCDLLLLDHAIDGVAGPTLVRHLARAAPSVLVVAFDEVGQSTADQAGELWPWREAEVALRRLLERRAPQA
jgi:CheY-like chemotaxis protein